MEMRWIAVGESKRKEAERECGFLSRREKRRLSENGEGERREIPGKEILLTKKQNKKKGKKIFNK